jgi:hypothetical protein
MIALAEFLSGASMVSFAACGIFFMKFWRASNDRFFLFFGCAVWLLGAERVVLLATREFSNIPQEGLIEATSWVYLIRLFAFALILIAIVEKNRKSRSDTKSVPPTLPMNKNSQVGT